MSEELRQRIADFARLWGAVLLPLGAWALAMSARYAIEPWTCRYGVHFISDAVAIAGVLLALAGGVLSWTTLARLRTQTADSEQSHERAHFMAALGLGLSLLFALVIIAQWIPERILSPCPL